MQSAAAARDNVVFIQILRGLAPLLVVFAHIPALWLAETKNQWIGFDLYRLMIIEPLQLNGGGGQLGVIVFFLISGFIISMVAEVESRREFLVKRIFRIFPALIAATFLGFLTVRISDAYGWGPIYSNDAVTTMDFVKSAFMISWLHQAPRALSVAWSLMPELIFYGLALLILPTMRAQPVKGTWLLTGFYCLLAAPMHVVPYFSYLGYFTVYLSLFVVGRVFYLSYVKRISNEQTVALLAVNLVLFVAIFNSRFPGELFRDYGRFYNIAYGCSIFFTLMVMRPVRCPAVIAALSNISYSLYLVHLSIGIFVLNALARVSMPFSLKVLVALVLSVAAAAASFYLVERPSQRLGRRLLAYRTKPRQPATIPGHR